MRLLKWLCPVLILCVGMAVYANSLQNGFTFDDWPLVVENPLVLQPDLGAIFTSAYWPGQPELGLYRPLTTLSYAINRWATGESAWGFHLINVLIHVLNALLVYGIALRYFDRIWAVFCAGLFLLNPVQTEAVNSIVGRAELLAGFWMLMAWGVFVCRSGWWRWGGAALAIFIACLCKEHSVMMVGVLGVLAIIEVRSSGAPNDRGIKLIWQVFKQTQLAGLLVCGGVVGLFLLIRYGVIGAFFLPAKPDFVDNPLAHVDVVERVLTAFSVIWHYVVLAFLLGDLSADYSYSAIPIVSSLWHLTVWGGLVYVGLLVGVIVRCLIKGTGVYPATAALWLLLPVIPVSNLFFPIGTVMAERLMYVPVMGCAMLFTICLMALSKQWPRLAMVLCAVILVGAGKKTVARNPDWQNNETLFRSAVQVVPNSAKAHFNLANAIRDRGDLQAALPHYYQALWVYPEYAEVHYNIGVVQQALGHVADALKAYQNALSANADHVNAWMNMGGLLAQQGEYEKAGVAFEKASGLAPHRVDIVFNKALALQALEKLDEAVATYQQVLALNPRYEEAAINLAELYVHQGQVSAGIAILQNMVNQNGAAYQAAMNLGALLEKEGRYEAAAKAFEMGARGSGARNALALFAAGRIYVRLGHVSEAKRLLDQFIARWPGDASMRIRAQNLRAQLDID